MKESVIAKPNKIRSARINPPLIFKAAHHTVPRKEKPRPGGDRAQGRKAAIEQKAAKKRPSGNVMLIRVAGHAPKLPTQGASWPHRASAFIALRPALLARFWAG